MSLITMPELKMEDIISKSVIVAEKWQDQANRLLTSEEKIIQEQMQSLLTHPADKTALSALIDQSFRSKDPVRVADQINFILHEYGVPDFFSRVERLLIQVFLGFGHHFAALTVPRFVDRMRHSSSRAIIPGEPGPLHAHLKKRRSQNVRMNINHLGEALLGEEEAENRLTTYIQDLQDPDIEYISIKISTIYSQISALAFDHTLSVLKGRLARLYRAAMENNFRRADGTQVKKMVNLDMEEYRDLEITYRAFIETLDMPEFNNCSAGIVLQAYIPDSFTYQKDLTAWAQNRVAKGGAPIKLRIVKGANMEMEQLEAALSNWPQAPYDNKADVDANYKRMVLYGMAPDRIKAVNLGIGSHNLFDLAFAQEVGKRLGVEAYYYFELLEGMVDHVRRALSREVHDVLLYAPVADKEEFSNAIAYLIRRLDENTAQENFLRHAPGLRVDTPEWSFLKEQFIKSCARIDHVPLHPRRTQDRRNESFDPAISPYYSNRFINEPNTDWTLKANRIWAADIRKQWMKRPEDPPLTVPVSVGDEEIFEGRKTREYLDLNQLPLEVVVARCALANREDVMRAVATAREDPDGWRKMAGDARRRILTKAAMELRRARADLIGAAAATTGKIFTETDIEVSEAIDFTEFYPFSTEKWQGMGSIATAARGAGLVISPWNFPVAIPCGGVVATLATGNTCLFKPSSEAILPAYRVAQCFWRAGVPRSALQFIPCSGKEVGPVLTSHPDVDFVILTGGTDTGLGILKQKPGMYLAAETGGKNATIVTDMADRDQAIKNVIYSAFGNSGQKCSATSLLILERSIYENKHFKRQLVDAARSFKVGSAWAFESKMGALIKAPSGDLYKALTTLEEGEEWALKPRQAGENPYLWRPGIKYGVRPRSYTHMTEFFGPVLGVMVAENLDQAIELVNMTGYGLTSGLESLDRREQTRWRDRILAGNLYINRGTTGAVTLRQPFGGMGKSAVGPAIKAGSPDYVSQFMTYQEKALPEIGAIQRERPILHLAQQWDLKVKWGHWGDLAEDMGRTVRAVFSYLYWAEQKYDRGHDFFHLRGQDNVLRYLPVGSVVIRVQPEDDLFETLARIAAARVSGCQALVSLHGSANIQVVDFLEGREGRLLLSGGEVLFQSDDELAAMIPNISRIRYAAPERVSAAVMREAAESGFYIARAPVCMDGRLELLHYYRQQSVCNNYHRYGNLGERGIKAVNTLSK